jgi:hypothetical protein
MAVHVLFEVDIQELKHQVQLAVLVHHVLQAAVQGQYEGCQA